MKYPALAILALEDGTIFEGISVGYHGNVVGEAVFNTAQTGYQEILTDPSYAEQIITFTQPHIGNVGVNTSDMESDTVFAKGVIMRSLCEKPSNWRSENSLQDFFQQHKIVALSEIDTRALTHHLRSFGAKAACLMTKEICVETAIQMAKNFSGITGKNITNIVTTNKMYSQQKNHSPEFHIIVYDFGVKKSILTCLTDRNCKLTIVPANTKAKDILALKPDGILLSNGPGDPAACTDIIAEIKQLFLYHIPIMAICLGHQLLALASGATTKKMLLGHHGANHPIQCLATGKVTISSQNHGFVVAEENLPAQLKITHKSLFDGTIAGIARIDIPAFGFQGHPEASPGPTELQYLFDHFLATIKQVSYAQAI